MKTKLFVLTVLIFALLLLGASQAANAQAPSLLVVASGQIVTVAADMNVTGIRVNTGGELRFAPNSSVTISSTGNVIVSGTLTMQPASAAIRHTLRFVGIDESKFVGGGMIPLATDVGLWVIDGKLNILGTPKTAWTRAAGNIAANTTTITLIAPPVGWQVGDQISIVPTAAINTGATFYSGFDWRTITAINGAVITINVPTSRAHPINTNPFDGSIYTAEVLNLNRNVRIEGQGDGGVSPTTNHRAHVFIHSMYPQSIRFAEIRYVGPRKPFEGYTSSILGRYGLHFHMNYNDSRGTLIEGVVVRDAGAHAFVPHASHGITIKDTISYNTFDDAYWWDFPPCASPCGGEDSNDSSDILIDHAVAAQVRTDPTFRGYRLSGFVLGKGISLTMQNSLAVGVQGTTDAAGFGWPEPAHGVWDFDTGNVAHNNAIDGIFGWQNDELHHIIANFVGYNNGTAGIVHGAYVNVYQYDDMFLFGNGKAFISKALDNGITRPDGYGLAVEGLRASGRFVILEHTVGSGTPNLVKDCVIGGVTVDERNGPTAGKYDFVNCTNLNGAPLSAADFITTYAKPGSVWRVQNADGSAFRMTGSGVLTTTAPFYTDGTEDQMALSDSLAAYYALENVNDSLGLNNLTNNATATFVSGKVGNAGNFVSASSQFLSHTDTATLDMGDIDFTITAWARLATKPAAVMGVMGKSLATGNQRGYSIQWDNVADRFRFVMSSDGTSTNQVIVVANNFGAPSTGTYYFIAARYNAATDTMSISINNGTPDTGTLAGGAFANTAAFELGRAVGGNHWNGLIDEVGIWKRYLSNAEIALLYNSGSGRDYTYVSAATTYNLSLAQGSYAYTGQTVTLKAARTLALAQGSYVLSGQTLGIRASRTLALGQGSYTLSGQTVALKAGRTLAIAQGSFALGGQDVGLRASRLLALAQGSYALSGQDAGLRASRLLTLEQGGYTLTGEAVAMLIGRMMALGQGSYALGGQSVSLLVSRLLALGRGSYALAGQILLFERANFEPPLTPDERIFVLDAENRAVVVEAESRMFAVEAEDRTFVI